jgi:hypothetical protein
MGEHERGEVNSKQRFELRRDCAPQRPHLPEYGVMPLTALLEASGKTSFSKLKRCFNFEEEEQRNEFASAHWAEANDMELAPTKSAPREVFFARRMSRRSADECAISAY